MNFRTCPETNDKELAATQERTKGEENAARPIQTLEQEGVRCVAAKILKTQKDSQGVV